MGDSNKYDGLMLKRNCSTRNGYAPVPTVDNYITLIRTLIYAKSRYNLDTENLGKDLEGILNISVSDYNQGQIATLNSLMKYVMWFRNAEINIKLPEIAAFFSEKIIATSTINTFKSYLKSLEAMKALNITHLAVLDDKICSDETPIYSSEGEYSQIFGYGCKHINTEDDPRNGIKQTAFYDKPAWLLSVHDMKVEPYKPRPKATVGEVSSMEEYYKDIERNFIKLSEDADSKAALYGRRILAVHSSQGLLPNNIDCIMESKYFPNYEAINALLRSFNVNCNRKDPVKRK